VRNLLLSFITVLLLTSCAAQNPTTVSQAVLEPEPTEFVAALPTPLVFERYEEEKRKQAAAQVAAKKEAEKKAAEKKAAAIKAAAEKKAVSSTPTKTATVKTAVTKKETPAKAVSTRKEVSSHKLQQLQKHMVKHGLSSSTAKRYAGFILDSAAEFNLDPYLILAMISVETGKTFKFKNYPNSHGAIGLMQILSRNAKGMGVSVSALYDPKTNIRLGSKYLKYLQGRFGYDGGITAYNQGEGNVARGTYNTKYLRAVKSAYSSIQK